MINAVFYQARVRALLSVLSHLPCGSLAMTLPDGSRHHFTGPAEGPAADIHIHTERALGMMMSDGKLGFCEAFMQGEASSADLPRLIELVVRQNDFIEQNLQENRLFALLRRYGHWRNRNSRQNARRNIAYHYDLGNAFYAAWLDPSMTYSSAVFGHGCDDLELAQQEKYRRLAALADIRAGDKVLEIGCGWGGFAEYAAGLGAEVTAITISEEQFTYARDRIQKAGLEGCVKIQLCDYRDLQGRFDKIVSIEMFEAVGEQYWPQYFDTVSRLLPSGGKAALQIITIDPAVYDSYRSQPDFIQRYIFPGGMLPSMPALSQPLGSAGLQLVEENGYALDYARTLATWRERFLEAWPQLKNHGFDGQFRRMWELYLAYCEGGFRGGQIDLKQLLLVRS